MKTQKNCYIHVCECIIKPRTLHAKLKINVKQSGISQKEESHRKTEFQYQVSRELASFL